MENYNFNYFFSSPVAYLLRDPGPGISSHRTPPVLGETGVLNHYAGRKREDLQRSTRSQPKLFAVKPYFQLINMLY